MHIKILRGPHDLSIVDEVVQAIKGMDIVFLETVVSPGVSRGWENYF
ncbi:MAG TPA: hypothetical protein VK983_04950 [Candidatus Limnocylindrales bacterium]|nr:hypothetical protein [Candidatus Limnocylindrales bacterium]